MKLDKFTYFYPEKPILISKEQDLFKKFSKDSNWIAEKKYNGNRLILHYINGKFQFWNRHNEIFSFKPDLNLYEILHNFNLKGYCVFDGELRHNRVKNIRQKMVLWDVFVWNGEILNNNTYQERHQIIQDIISEDGDIVGCPHQFKKDFDQVFEEVTKDEEIEGLVIKKTTGKLGISRKSCQNSKWMYKVRKPHSGGNYKF